MDKKVWQWERDDGSQKFLISSQRDLLPVPYVQKAFATEAMFWAQPLSAETTRAMLDQSLTLGIYRIASGSEDKTPIGMARMITDYTTLIYLTDVFLEPEYRGSGLGQWIIHCCRSIALEVPDLRYMVLLTGSEQAEKFYRRELGMVRLNGDEQKVSCMGARSQWMADVSQEGTAGGTSG